MLKRKYLLSFLLLGAIALFGLVNCSKDGGKESDYSLKGSCYLGTGYSASKRGPYWSLYFITDNIVGSSSSINKPDMKIPPDNSQLYLYICNYPDIAITLSTGEVMEGRFSEQGNFLRIDGIYLEKQ